MKRSFAFTVFNVGVLNDFFFRVFFTRPTFPSLGKRIISMHARLSFFYASEKMRKREIEICTSGDVRTHSNKQSFVQEELKRPERKKVFFVLDTWKNKEQKLKVFCKFKPNKSEVEWKLFSYYFQLVGLLKDAEDFWVPLIMMRIIAVFHVQRGFKSAGVRSVRVYNCICSSCEEKH